MKFSEFPRLHEFMCGARLNNCGVDFKAEDDIPPQWHEDEAKVAEAELAELDVDLNTFMVNLGALCDSGYTLSNNQGEPLLAFDLWERLL